MSARARAAAARPMPLLDAWKRHDVLFANDTVRRAIEHEAEAHLIADDAWAWYLAGHTHAKGISLDLGELGCVAPPYPAMWIEGAVNLADWYKNVRDEPRGKPITRVGVMLAWYDHDEWVGNEGDRAPLYGSMWNELVWDQGDSEVRWVVGATTTALFDGDPQPRFAPLPAVATINAQGTVMGWRVLGAEQAPEGQVETGVPGTAAFGLMLGLCAVQFLHVRNVRTVEGLAPELRRGKKSTRGTLPAYRYHVLDVTGLRSRWAAEGGDPLDPGAARAAIAMHTVHGHFKTYTEDAPLMGRHVGRYFWRDHVRGSTPDRVVEKAYHPDPQEPA